MPYTIQFLEDKRIVIIENIGKISSEEFEKQSVEALELGRNNNTSLFLADSTQIAGRTTPLELLDFPDMYERIGAPKTTKLAIVLPENSIGQENIKFLETVCLNRGWQVKIFETKDLAIDWLIKKLDPNS
jgi:hypothetical protein